MGTGSCENISSSALVNCVLLHVMSCVVLVLSMMCVTDLPHENVSHCQHDPEHMLCTIIVCVEHAKGMGGS